MTRERGGAGGREARVQSEESSCWGERPGETAAVVKMQKDKGWPDNGWPSVVVASGKLWGSGLGLMGPL